MLSFDWFNFICMIINLLILYFLMKKFLFGRVNKILEDRKKEIEQGYKAVEEKEKKAEEVKNEYQTHLAEITFEKEQERQKNALKATIEYNKTISDANKRAEEIISNARQTARYESERAIIEQEKQMRQMVLSAASRLVSSEGDSHDEKLYDSFLEKAKNDASGGDK